MAKERDEKLGKEEWKKEVDEKAFKEAEAECGNFSFKLEGLKDGYRFTVRGDEEKIKENRRAAAAFINFTRQADRAGWWLPWPFRFLLKFWNRYKG
ncbi:hypothetical protein [Aneurinibacillus terranovensis]|uniref:hypothetical protein n=1 Tax=Aneurinibacillus terranovensis TaxID=278991 RepID=UPI0003FBF074|nr:hypothetical protein [Aneurinibacillus terranovensis]